MSLKNKRVRTIFTPEQLERLEAEFERQQYMVSSSAFLYLAFLTHFHPHRSAPNASISHTPSNWQRRRSKFGSRIGGSSGGSTTSRSRSSTWPSPGRDKSQFLFHRRRATCPRSRPSRTVKSWVMATNSLVRPQTGSCKYLESSEACGILHISFEMHCFNHNQLKNGKFKSIINPDWEHSQS